MFKFYANLAGRDIIIAAGRATTCRHNVKADSPQTKSTKNEGPPENIGFNWKIF